MPPRQTIIWTALPWQLLPDGRGQMAVLVTPRLQDTDVNAQLTLDNFPDIRDWPEVIAATTFSVRLHNSNQLVVAERISPLPDLTLWGALFPPTTPVRPFQFDDLSDRPIVSYPTAPLLDAVIDQYVTYSRESPDNLPLGLLHNSDFSLRWPSLRKEFAGLRRVDVIDEHFSTLANPDQQPPAADSTAQLLQRVMQFLLFHRPSDSSAAALSIPVLDFHNVVSSLGQYPQVLRWLGLLIDLAIPDVASQPSLQAVEVVPALPPPRPVNATSTPPIAPPQIDAPVTPSTACEPPFRAKSFAPYLQRGFLNVATPDFRAVTIDLDGVLFKLLSFADTLAASDADPRLVSEANSGLPALHSAGITIAWSQRVANLRAALSQSSMYQQTLPNVGLVAAQNLTRGYRIDVQPTGAGPWLSLHGRRESYQFLALGSNGNRLGPQDSEGWLSTAVTETDGGPVAIRLAETICHWQGWSLSVPRPGATISPQPDPTSPDHNIELPDRRKTQPPPEFQLRSDFDTIPRSLPKLRFGKSYRLRARAVDLAGQSVPVTVDEPLLTTEPIYYGRFDPVPPPVVLLSAAQSKETAPGEAIERLVIRSENVDRDADAVATTALAERHLASPSVSQELAEAHGKFDELTPQESYQLIIANAGSWVTVPGSDPLATSQQVTPEGTLILPYLPDPLVRGIAFCNLPGLAAGMMGSTLPGADLQYSQMTGPDAPPGSLTTIDVGPDPWPKLQGLRIRLAEGSGPPIWNPVTRLLTVFLAKGLSCVVRYSSFVEKDDLERSGLWQLIEKRDPQSLARFARAAIQGRHWMVTPYREFVLTHAVRQPLGLPKLDITGMQRDEGATFVRLLGHAKVDQPSTSHLEMRANWQEPRDLPGSPPERILVTAHVGESAIPAPILSSATAFAGNEPREILLDLALPLPELRHEFGDNKHRLVTYEGVAISRYRDCFPEDGTNATRLTESFDISIPSSARPSAPRPTLVLPTFAWSRSASGNTVTSFRRGGLRVYLGRPWHSSGDGELLGVVYLPPPFPATPDEAAQLGSFVTRFGADPIALHPETPLARSDQFPLAKTVGTGLQAQELNPRNVEVAGHEVVFDSQRDEWFADIQLSQLTYFPFVRLALARYQPDALPGLELSQIVLSEIVQLPPERTVILERQPDPSGSIAIQLRGEVPMARATEVGLTPAAMPEIEVSLQRRRPEIADETLGWITETVLTGQPVPPAIPLQVPPPGPLLWHGQVMVPVAEPATLRLVIKEFELFVADMDSGVAGAAQVQLARRLVYMDILIL